MTLTLDVDGITLLMVDEEAVIVVVAPGLLVVQATHLSSVDSCVSSDEC